MISKIRLNGKMSPLLRFPEFTSNWSNCRIDSIFIIKAGGDIESKNVSKDRNKVFKYPIYANAEKDKGLYGYSDLYKIETPSITVAGRGVNVGIAHARHHKFYPIVRLLVLTPKKKQSIEFFEHAINRLRIFIESTGVPQLTGPQISKYSLLYPTLPEQQKIAAFLSAVDRRIALLNRKKALLEQHKKGVMQKLFSQEIRFKDDDGNDFPDWEEKRLGEVGMTYNGLTGKTKEDFGKGYPYVSYKQIFENSRIDPQKFDFVKIAPDEKQNLVEYGDVFFTTSSETRLEVGYSSVLLDEIPCLYLNSFCFGFRINSQDEFLPLYARYLFRSKNFRRAVVKLSQGSTRYNMSKNEMKKINILLPKIAEQSKIATCLSNIDNKIEAIDKQITRTQDFKKGLLQQMFV